MVNNFCRKKNLAYLKAAASLHTRRRAIAVEKAAKKARQGASLRHQDFLLPAVVPVTTDVGAIGTTLGTIWAPTPAILKKKKKKKICTMLNLRKFEIEFKGWNLTSVNLIHLTAFLAVTSSQFSFNLKQCSLKSSGLIRLYKTVEINIASKI